MNPILIFCELNKISHSLAIRREWNCSNCIFIIVLWYIRTKNVRQFLDKHIPIFKKIKVLQGVQLINEWFKIVQGYPSQVRDSKKYLVHIFQEFSFTSSKIYLALENKGTKVISIFSAKGIRFLNVPIFSLGLWCWLANQIEQCGERGERDFYCDKQR